MSVLYLMPAIRKNLDSSFYFMRIPCWILLTLVVGASAALGAETKFVVRPFLDQHCVKCHGADEQKADLRLDTLAEPPNEPKVWLSILEAIETGDMPPKKEPRPNVHEADRLVAYVSEVLAEVSGPPPVALRRMNRVEFESTVHDLLGIDTELADLLPEDSRTQGFDNVGDGLGISPVLLEKYLEAADAAFDGVIRRIKPLPPEVRPQVAMESKTNLDSVKGKKGGVIAVENSFVKFTPGWPDVRLEGVHPIEGGVYRCRVQVWPYQPGERTLSVAVFTGPLFGPGKRHFQGMFDVTGTPEKPRLIEFTTFMNEGDAIHVLPWIYPKHISYIHKDEPKPGVAVTSAETYGPLDQDFPSLAQKRLFGDFKHITMAEGSPIYMRHRRGVKLHFVESSQPREDAERIIRGLVPRAFRRPVESAVEDQFVNYTLERLELGRTFEQAVRAGVTAVLSSPYFLLLNQESVVDDFTIASRMSYFLWSSMPDEELMNLAATGRLKDPKVRSAQVDRMLADKRSERFVNHFTGQWLNLREISFTTPDGSLYPEFDELLERSMMGEAHGFFRHLIKENLGVRHLIQSNFTLLNERLALHYGITGVKGHEKFRVVELPKGSVRGGLLSQAAVLKVTANGTTTSPVLRGVWLLDRMLGLPVPPPPPAVPAVEPDIRGATSVREVFSKHTANESCARCHDRIDPPGFALEHFDPIGGEREFYRSLGEGKKVEKVGYLLSHAVDASGELFDGQSFDSFLSFREWMLSQEEQVARSVAQKLLVYATGRRIGVMDREAVEQVVEAARSEKFGIRSMIQAVVESELFHRP